MSSSLSEDQAEAHVHGICLKTGPPFRVGVELEWLVRDARDPSLPVAAERVAEAVAGFGAGENASADQERTGPARADAELASAGPADRGRIDGERAGSGRAGRADAELAAAELAARRLADRELADRGLNGRERAGGERAGPGHAGAWRASQGRSREIGTGAVFAGTGLGGENGGAGARFGGPGPARDRAGRERGGWERGGGSVSENGRGIRGAGAAAGPPSARGTASSEEADRAFRYKLPVQSSPVTLPRGGLITTEPGGQLELSSAPAGSLAECVAATAADLALLREAVAAAGLELAGFGHDPVRPPRRVLRLPRYAAMEAYFDRDGPWGRRMMCSTASVQVCLDAGDDGPGESGYRSRWRLLHAVGPVLVAAFANSALRDGKPTGWRSSRQQAWARIDPGRTRAPALSGDPRTAWTGYALDAEVMCVRDDCLPDWTAPAGLTFRDWVRGAPCVRRAPTSEDLTYHLSTLFPPVRPRGHLELRMIDAQPGDGWIVPAAVATALADDPVAADAAMAAAEPLWSGADGDGTGNGADPWLIAARCGPSDPRLSRASRECFAAAEAALCRMGVPAEIRQAVSDFTEAYVLKDRCPADDQMEEVT